MALTRVTLTGADDTAEPVELREISKEFPFVEWGILIGSKNHVHRFPSYEWIGRLCEQRICSGNTMNLALHCCGDALRGIVAGVPNLCDKIGDLYHHFERVQLNFHGERLNDDAPSKIMKSFCELSLGSWNPTIIFQLDGVNDSFASSDKLSTWRIAGLFDRSHGAGVLPDQWPAARGDMECGWAGGLGPDNVLDQLRNITCVAALGTPFRDFWIDMETKLFEQIGRYDPRFSTEKCVEVLKIARQFIA